MKCFLIVCYSCISILLYAQKNNHIFYLPFNGNTLDETGNGNNAVNHGATLTTDRFGNQNSAYEFDGIDDFMQITPVSDLSSVGDYSISLWILHKNWKGTTQTNNIERQYIFDAHASSATATGNDIFKPGFVTAIDYNYTSNTENLIDLMYIKLILFRITKQKCNHIRYQINGNL
ncbi:MAG TPA: hypothetical protein P5243_07345 [Bacteroidales bacterium]|nr:hypothetical protein [Bacteroidales bacterium]